MLTFRKTKVLFGVLLGLLLSFDIIYDVPWWSYLILLFICSLLLFYGSAFVSSNFYVNVVSHGPERKRQIAITFDDGPAESFTEKILDILDSTKVPATFFCIGKNIRGREDLLVRMVNAGHIIGNHSFSHHFWFDLYGRTRITTELVQTNDAVEKVIGRRPVLFRPPYGVTTPNIASALKSTGMTTVGWNIRSMDTVVKDDKKLLQNVLAAVKPGAIVLFHDTSEATFSMLPAFIDGVVKKGFEIVSLDKMINIAPYA
jgi:peptidoglycan/xylan/chitin deacetylase (PgdA/CDA1 family)